MDGCNESGPLAYIYISPIKTQVFSAANTKFHHCA